MTKKMDRRKQYTRKVLKESLISLLNEKPMSNITVKEICELADINRSTFYTHYSDHYDLLHKIEEEITEDMVNYLNSYTFAIEEESVKVTEKLLDYIAKDHTIFEALLIKNGDPFFEQRLMNIARQFLIQQWMKANEVNPRHSNYLSTFVISGAIHVIKDWIKNKMDHTPKEMSLLINHYINHGLAGME